MSLAESLRLYWFIFWSQYVVIKETMGASAASLLSRDKVGFASSFEWVGDRPQLLYPNNAQLE
jgi:hypothetical protein